MPEPARLSANQRFDRLSEAYGLWRPASAQCQWLRMDMRGQDMFKGVYPSWILREPSEGPVGRKVFGTYFIYVAMTLQ